MRSIDGILMAGCVAWTIGCGPGSIGADDYDATVSSFTGQLTQNGKPIAFDTEEKVVLQLVYEQKGERFGIPIEPTGTFTIGWMPIGKYAAILERRPAPKPGERGGRPITYSVPDGLTIEEGKTDYTIDLGDSWKR